MKNITDKATYKLVSLLYETQAQEYEKNLSRLIDLIEQSDENSIIVAPEVCLTGFDYENLYEILDFADVADEAIKKVSQNKIIILTMLQKEGDEIYNFAKIYHNGEIIYKRAKAKLFRFSDEHKYMSEGSSKDIEMVEIDGIKIGILICFELRFKELWQKLEGCDLIAVPSWWGVLRSEHFKALTQSLAIMNQCFVVASDSKNEECTKMSGIITPHGAVERNDGKAALELEYSKKEITLMRRYMDVGIE